MTARAFCASKMMFLELFGVPVSNYSMFETTVHNLLAMENNMHGHRKELTNILLSHRMQGRQNQNCSTVFERLAVTDITSMTGNESSNLIHLHW